MDIRVGSIVFFKGNDNKNHFAMIEKFLEIDGMPYFCGNPLDENLQIISDDYLYRGKNKDIIEVVKY